MATSVHRFPDHCKISVRVYNGSMVIDLFLLVLLESRHMSRAYVVLCNFLGLASKKTEDNPINNDLRAKEKTLKTTTPSFLVPSILVSSLSCLILPDVFLATDLFQTPSHTNSSSSSSPTSAAPVSSPSSLVESSSASGIRVTAAAMTPSLFPPTPALAGMPSYPLIHPFFYHPFLRFPPPPPNGFNYQQF